ncbi:uncharacterized protein LOC118751875 [Rhagoletis pomonella]|uniref:uncharacterized protein LOC118751825 n=1 Tax=Rhagoletis pomonella TaxID=28610 RepID=UPI00177F74AD|nr:uncharacterized protein LOC118751825 [Rhagoletis pomonella]XP_036342593.1 uncharacterized protein LOC118751875 [Rhagoletis pomonella]
MFYFFHRYELPVIIQQAQILIITNNQNVAGNGPQQRQQQQLQGQGRPAAIIMGRLFRRPARQQQQQQQEQQLIDALRNQRQIPFVGGLLQRRVGAVDTLRRTLLQRGWMGAPRVRVQIANLQRINLRSIQINPANLDAAAASAAGEAATGDGAGSGSGTGGTTIDGNITITQVADADGSTNAMAMAMGSNTSSGSGQTIGITISFNPPATDDVDTRSATGAENVAQTPPSVATSSLNDARTTEAMPNTAAELQPVSTTITAPKCENPEEESSYKNEANINNDAAMSKNDEKTPSSSIESQSNQGVNKEPVLNEEKKQNTDNSLGRGTFENAVDSETTQQHLEGEYLPARNLSASVVCEEGEGNSLAEQMNTNVPSFVELSPIVERGHEVVVAILNTSVVSQPLLLPNSTTVAEATSSASMQTTAASPNMLAASQHTHPARTRLSPIAAASVVSLTSTSPVPSAATDNVDVTDDQNDVRSHSENTKPGTRRLNSTDSSQAMAVQLGHDSFSNTTSNFDPQETPITSCCEFSIDPE